MFELLLRINPCKPWWQGIQACGGLIFLKYLCIGFTGSVRVLFGLRVLFGFLCRGSCFRFEQRRAEAA